MWADPVVDFGGEAYVAWRLSAGDVLYRDLAYFTGPLSPYLNSLWMRVFGASLTTLAGANLALLALSLVVLYRLLGEIASRLAASVACVMFTVLCALAVHQGAGNYNFVWPYSHEMTHATLLALVSFALAARWSRQPSPTNALWLGLVCGLVVLTKVEFTAALGAGLTMVLVLTPIAGPQKLKHGLLALSATCVAPSVAFAALATAMPAREAWRGVLGAWIYVGDERVGDFPLYRAALGLLGFGHHALRIVLWGLGTLAFVAVARALARRLGTLPTLAVTTALCTAAFAFVPWVDAFYPLSFSTAALLVFVVRRRADHPLGALRAGFVAFALVLLLRIALNVRVQFYGFALAGPAVVVSCAALMEWIPATLERGRRALQVALLPALASVVLGHLLPMARGLRWNTVELGTGPDRMLVGPRGDFVAQALALIEKRCPAQGSVLVLPEGALINYLSRRRAPTRFFNFMPPELEMFGESAMVAALDASPPDLIVLVHRDTTEYGLPYFGRDYGAALYGWVKAHYRPLKLWSIDPKERPFEPGTRHAIAVLERAR